MDLSCDELHDTMTAQHQWRQSGNEEQREVVSIKMEGTAMEISMRGACS